MFVGRGGRPASGAVHSVAGERVAESREVAGAVDDIAPLKRGTRIFFLIRSLERGGAERQLIGLVDELARAGMAVTVCTFYDGGALRDELDAIPGVAIISLGKQGRWDIPRFLLRLGRAVRSTRPDIIHAYMGVANELSTIMAAVFGLRAVWGVRSSNMDFSQYDAFSRREFQVGALFSRYADRIIVNSQAGWEHHALHGYPSARMTVVPNGIDCERFRPDQATRQVLRAEWGIQHDELLVGLIARLDPKKDHANFLKAAALTKRRHPRARFVCVGDGPTASRDMLVAQANALGLASDVLWSPAKVLVQDAYNACDVVVLSSAFGEGFPNVVGEAMACGKLCVVTNVGDAAVAVGEVGIVVPPRNAMALADGISCLLDLSEEDARALRSAARERMLNLFSKRQLAAATSRVLGETLQRAPGRSWL